MVSVALLLLIAATVLFLVASLYLGRNARRKADSKLPPGSMGWPLIGDTFSFVKPRPVTSMGEYMEHHISRFGRIFSANLFGKLAIVSADPELNRFILKNDMRLFEYGWPRSFGKLIGELSISMLEGDAHKRMRSIILDFLSSERLRSVFLQDAEQIASLLLSSWNDSVVSVTQEANKFSFYIMGKGILSMSPGGAETEKLRRKYEAFVGGLISFPLNIPGTTYWRALQSRADILKDLKQIMEERMRTKGGRNAITEKDDYLCWVMKNTRYSQEQICDLLLHMLFAGHDTTSRAIPLMIYFLEGCPKAIEALRQEHLQVVRSKQQEGDSKLTWDDYKRMEFTQCVVDETLRLGSVVGHSMKKAIADIQFNDYVIPRGCIVLPHFRAIHFDPSLFEDPMHFNPWRWLCSSGATKNNNFMPFGGGARFCPGAELARLEMTVFLHHLILNCDWELVEPDHPVSIPIVKFPKGLPIRVRAVHTAMPMSSPS